MTQRIKNNTNRVSSAAERAERDRTVPSYVRGAANKGAWWRGYKSARSNMPKKLNPYRSAGSVLRGNRGPTRVATLATKWDEGWVYYAEAAKARRLVQQTLNTTENVSEPFTVAGASHDTA